MLSRTNAKYWSHMATAVLAAIVATSCLLAEAKLPRKIALEGATYTMKSEFDSAHGIIQVEEFHSNQQQRSRVNYLLKGYRNLPDDFLAPRGSFIADVDGVTEMSTTQCRTVGHDAIEKALQSDMLDSSEATSSHVIGAARFLMAIEINSEKFQPKVQPAGEGVPGAAELYEAELEEYKVIVYYESDRVLPLGVPSAVHVSHIQIAKSILVRLKLLNLMKPHESILTRSASLSGAQQASNRRDELLFDVFAIERARGCTEYSKSVTSFVTDKHRFSFKAHLLSKNNRPVELVVGYEPELETLRVDHSYGTKWSQTLTNFRHNRRYNVVRRVTGGEGGPRPHEDYLDARQANDVSCVVTQAGLARDAASDGSHAYPLDRMLNGATRVTYLGMARVRGIDAHVYEAYDSKLPVWLDVPSAYESRKGIKELRDGRLQDDGSSRILTTVLYYSQPLSTFANDKLLLIEIFSASITSANLRSNMYTIPIYEFSWDIRPVAHTGERWEDFFSLGDVCLAPSSGNNHYARLNLRLKVAGLDGSHPELTDSAWIQTPAKRNVALIKAIDNEFKLPSTLIYDLESRKKGSQVIISMQIAERESVPVTIKYLGRSRAAPRDCEKSKVISFQQCLELAPLMHMDTIFGYMDATPQSMCIICRETRLPTDPTSAGHSFSIHPTGPYEVYRSVYGAESESAHDDHITKLDETRNRMLEESRKLLDNPNHDEIRPSVPFKVLSVEVEHLNEKVSYDLDEHHLADVNKFPGLGLVADDPQNKLVEPKEVSESAITFEQCQETCLIDLECEAYSTCIVDGNVQCVLSSVDFKVPTTVIELMLLKDKKSKLGEVSEIRLTGGESEVSTQAVDLSIVHIKKHPTCELHNKLYRDVFKRAGLVKIDLKGRLLRPVSHPEQCAEFCFLGTLATMRKELRRLHKTIHDKEDPGLSEGYSASHCGHYFYLEEQKLARSEVKIPAEQIIGVNTDGATRGYCVFDDGSTSGGDVPGTDKKKQKDARVSSSSESSSSSLTFELRKFALDFSFLYEKKHGVSLVSSAMSPDEQAANAKLANKLNYTNEQLEIMRKFIQAGGNIAKLGPAVSAQECARTCFTQSIGLWPACQSFDIVELELRETATRMTVCVYSTSTVRELRKQGRTDLILETNTQKYFFPQASDEIQVWHYEPRQGLVASSVDQQHQISLDQSETRLDQMRRMTGASLHLSTFSLFFSICIVIAAGLGVGMRMSSSPRVGQILSLAGLASGQSRGDAETLVDDADGL